MAYTLPQAAIAAERDRTTILRMIKAGKLSATRDPVSNDWLIEPAELHRVYPARADAAADAQQRSADAAAVIEARLEAERARAAVLEGVVADLRRRLDAEAEERRRLTALLTDRRAPATPIRRWWRFGR
jgi:hypothetical protein